MKKIKILAIGNSFSQDAIYYLNKMADEAGVDTKIVNLYVAACSLEMHWDFMHKDEKAYSYELNGEATGKKVSVKEALLEEDWDYVITQQASYDSGIDDLYHPFIELMYDFIKEYNPNGEIVLHETWAFEKDSWHDYFVRYHNDQNEMYERLEKCNKKAASQLGIRLIPAGDIIQKLRKVEPFIYEKGGISLCRDTFHMNYLYGRYIVGAAWFEVLFKKNIMESNFIPSTDLVEDDTVDIDVLNMIKKYVHEECESQK